MSIKNFILKIVRLTIGLTVFSFGVFLTIKANIGYAPWDSFSFGLAKYIPLNYGEIVTITSIIFVIVDLLMGENIGFGTIIDALYTGNCIQFFYDHFLFEDCNNLIVSLLVISAGFFFMGLGQYMYMKEGQSCGPKDSFLIGLGKRFPNTRIGVIEIMILATALLLALIFKGPIGIGTVYAIVGMGTWMQLVFGIFKFDPRTVKQLSILETIKEVKNNA